MGGGNVTIGEKSAEGVDQFNKSEKTQATTKENNRGRA